jgi:hypothetical protein
MSNKYADLVKIIKQSRENIRPALQGSIFEREMLGSDVLKGEEAKIRALEEIKQLPEIKIVDEQQSKRKVLDDDEEEKKDIDDDDKEEFNKNSLDISKLKLTPKTTFKALRNRGVGQKYFVLDTDDFGEQKIVIYQKQTRKGMPPTLDADELDSIIPVIRGRIPLDVGRRQIEKFTSLLRKGKAKDTLNRKITDFYEPIEGKGFYDPRILIGAYLAKNNNKQLENLVLNKFLNM